MNKWRTSITNLDSLNTLRATSSASIGGASSASCDNDTRIQPLPHPRPFESVRNAGFGINNNPTHNSFAKDDASSGTVFAPPISPPFFRTNDILVAGGNYVPIKNQSSRYTHTNAPVFRNVAEVDTPTRDRVTPQNALLTPNAPSTSTSTNTAKMYPPEGKVILYADMDRALGYCYDRGDGQFTRLVPVDQLPVLLEGIPARVSSDEGMIVLPVPSNTGHDGEQANNQLVPFSAVTVSLPAVALISLLWGDGVCNDETVVLACFVCIDLLEPLLS